MSSALALVNTRFLRGGDPIDVIAEADGAARWLAARALLPADCRVTGPEAIALRALREAVRGLLAARTGAQLPAASDIGLLNATLASAPPIPALAWDESGPRTERVRQTSPGGLRDRTAAVSIALSRLADDALGLLTASGGAEPAPCGAHGCTRWFIRTHAARQWCSNRCGDRVRAARHYARHHPGGQS